MHYHNPKMKMEENQGKVRLTNLYTRNLCSIPIGVTVVGVLNFFTPLEFFNIQRAFLLSDGGWVVFPVFLPLVVTVICALQYLIQRPISGSLRVLKFGGENRKDIIQKGKRRLLNLPFILGFLDLILWVFFPAFMTIFFILTTNMSIKDALFIYFRAIMVGMISSSISFFLVENYSREKLIPRFFPDGNLTAVRGAIKILLRRRVRILYMAGSVLPMTILVGTIFFALWRAEHISIQTLKVGREILIFTVILCGIFIIIGLKLNELVGNSILEPLIVMLKMMGKVKQGNFSERVRVVSNDELGVLGDAGNDMIAGLLEREKIKDTFGKYVAPEIRDKILGGNIPVDGEKIEATLLFSDLRDFTKYVDENDPEDIIRSLRSYFTAMQDAIRKHQGLVLQYVGDEIQVVFGVPLPYAGHADNAIAAAIEMRKNLESLNTERLKMGKVPFRHGIGIHTGEVLAGNTGSTDRLSYALIGSAVNLASRIEQLTKTIRTDILISEQTVKRLTSSIPLIKYLHQSIKGFSKPVTVYSIS